MLQSHLKLNPCKKYPDIQYKGNLYIGYTERQDFEISKEDWIEKE